MSLRQLTVSAASRLGGLSRRRVCCGNNNIYNHRLVIVQRKFSAPASSTKNGKKAMTAEEIDAALEKANESMKEYYQYPVEKVIAAKKAQFNKRHRGKEFYLQLGLGMSLLCSFLATPFVGRKIAYDEEFKQKYIPSWYDYTLEKPKSAWTRAELQEHLVKLRTELHERAIRGEFTPEKLEEMRRNLEKKPEKAEHAHFAQLHPGVDDDEELEDD
ncbi:hypothetical protein ACHAWT_009046 [Skeletonema menzelii]|mmetsp:Transcript_20420/g.33622  ORF Transcript_20420/g.33622 Transcript_20420/m.33622 type:complete len:215 (-) Transcript_20420:58-702(-)|eukprot:scaffold26736_cov151-Skeletonema_menzelii.AAC.4